MKAYGDLGIGVATHTGCVRRTNEDDFLILMLEDVDFLARRGRLVALADGMGGVTGGAEASRAAIRAVSEAFLADEPMPEDPAQRMREGFARACRRVCALSRESPSLRGMGTTLTVLNLVKQRVVLGHVGDSRCYLLRGDRMDRLTEDHALRGRENRLTRCVGGGRETEEADIVELDVQPGDRFLLVTDGLWDAVSDEEMQRALFLPPQTAADELVRLANSRGGPDNSTAIVVHIGPSPGQLEHLRELDLPTQEARQTPVLPSRGARLHAPRWPWLVLLLSAALAGLAFAKVNGFDVLAILLR